MSESIFEVKATSLDEFAEQHPSPDVIKIDIEGGEGKALMGACRCLRQIRPLLLLEIHSEEQARIVYEIMQEHSYRLLNLKDNCKLIECLQEMPTHAFRGHLLGFPAERQPSFLYLAVRC